MPTAHVMLEQMDRLIGLILQAPATAAAARIVLCLPFWWSGLSKLLDFSGGTAEVAALGPVSRFRRLYYLAASKGVFTFAGAGNTSPL